MSEELDTIRYQNEEEQDTAVFLQAAVDAFGREHCGLPDGMVVDLFRRISTLPSSSWASILCGVLPITLYSPGSPDLPSALRYVTTSWHEVFCFRSAYALVDPPVDSPVEILLAGQGEP